MPQLTKKRRSGWAIFTVGTLVASLFAVGAAPAAAITEGSEANAGYERTACLGPALDDAGFADVSMGGSHYDNIQCLAHYGITTGREGGTQFAPHDNVTRSQMALFLSRMAGVAGVALDDAMGAGFTDLDGIGADRVDAINRLVNAGVMTASGEGTFSPLAHVSRAEMALWLVTLVDLTSDDVTLDPVSGEYVIAGVDAMNADSFNDSLVSQPIHVHRAINAAFELGITTGYSDLEFKGDRLVSRQEMATFIIRTMSHTNARPAGLTAQRNGDDIEVALRGADFAPIVNAPVDVFATGYPADAFDEDGECTRFALDISPGTGACEIDNLDVVTDSDGNAYFDATEADVSDAEDTMVACNVGTVGSGLYPSGDPVGSVADLTIWAWTGELEDEVDEDTDLVEVVEFSKFSRAGSDPATIALASGGLDGSAGTNQQEAEFGDTVTYTIQIISGVDDMGSPVPAAPDSGGNDYAVVISRYYITYVDHDSDEGTADDPTPRVRADDGGDAWQPGETLGLQDVYDRSTMTLSPDANGTLVIPISQSDPHRGNGNDMVVRLEVSPDPDNRLTVIRDTGVDTDPNDPAVGFVATFSDSVTFSDDPGDPSRYDMSVSSATYRLAPGSGSASNTVTVMVLNQYGRPVRGFAVNAISDQDGDTGEGMSTMPFVQYFTTRSNGSHTIRYSYTGDPTVEEVTAFGAVRGEDGSLPQRNRTPDTNGDNVGEDRELDYPAEDDVQGATDLLPAAKPTVAVLWAGIGVDPSSPTGDPLEMNDNDEAAAGELLVVDVATKTFVVFEDDGPRLYTWDSVDTFTVGNDRVSMALFEEILEGGTKAYSAEIVDLQWESYNVGRPVDRADWTIRATCTKIS